MSLKTTSANQVLNINVKYCESMSGDTIQNDYVHYYVTEKFDSLLLAGKAGRFNLHCKLTRVRL